MLHGLADNGRAYELWSNHFLQRWYPEPLPKNTIKPHASHDQVAALCAVRGRRDYWTTRTDGVNTIFEDGTNAWQPGPERGRGYLLPALPVEAVAGIIDDLMIAAGKRSEH
jgi:hypothetical protein